MMLLPPSLDEMIDKNHPVRIVSQIIDQIDITPLEKKYKGVKFISVHTQQEQPENVAKFVKSLAGAPSNIVLTSGGVQETFHYLGLPHTMVLDSNNVVLMNLVGYTPDNMERLNRQLQQMSNK